MSQKPVARKRHAERHTVSKIPIKLTPSQRECIDVFDDHDYLYLLGEAGTGKTTLAITLARKLIREGRVDGIITMRPAVETFGERLGFLPGDVNDKIAVYHQPIFNAIKEVCEEDEAEQLRLMTQMHAFAFVRGWTFKNKIIILDEAQNCKQLQLETAVTRLGLNSKMVICGDPHQSDLGDEENVIERFADAQGAVPRVRVAYIPPKDNVRNPILPKVIAAFRNV